MAKDKFPLIFLNPYTKRGSEVYVALDKETYKWYFNHGQERINYKYRDTSEEALGDMLKYADTSKIKQKLPISEVLHWSNIPLLWGKHIKHRHSTTFHHKLNPWCSVREHCRIA